MDYKEEIKIDERLLPYFRTENIKKRQDYFDEEFVRFANALAYFGFDADKIYNSFIFGFGFARTKLSLYNLIKSCKKNNTRLFKMMNQITNYNIKNFTIIRRCEYIKYMTEVELPDDIITLYEQAIEDELKYTIILLPEQVHDNLNKLFKKVTELDQFSPSDHVLKTKNDDIARITSKEKIKDEVELINFFELIADIPNEAISKHKLIFDEKYFQILSIERLKNKFKNNEFNVNDVKKILSKNLRIQLVNLDEYLEALVDNKKLEKKNVLTKSKPVREKTVYFFI